jgi:hypothetical protein
VLPSGDEFICSTINPKAAACAGINDGLLCSVGDLSGLCVGGVCSSVELDDCADAAEGDDCIRHNGASGTCNEVDGVLQCGTNPVEACLGLPPGSPCGETGYSYCGTTSDDSLVCIDLLSLLTGPCVGVNEGGACSVDGFEGVCGSGFCYSTILSVPCEEKDDGEACEVTIGGGVIPGTCYGDCQPGGGGGGGPGGIDGMGVDACGNVYAAEFTNGNVWRMDPEGTIDLLVSLPSSWIPNIKWGRGVGGFSRTVMYVADRDQASLFAVDVQVPGATEFYDVEQP